MAFATARLIALRSALLIIFVASNPAPINAPTRNVGWLPTGCGKMPEESLPDGRDGEAVAKMRREESLLQGGTQRWDDACRII
jgi:hypothetical protein